MIRIDRLTADQITAAQTDLVALLTDVVNGGASVNFLAPLDPTLAVKFWTKIANEAESGERIVLVAYEGATIVGCVHLVLAMQPNGPHRAEVQKLLVHSQHRRKGIGALLLKSVEEAARDCGRKLLVLDTERGSIAEGLYEKAGYSRTGIIPQFALTTDGTLIDTVVFYRFV